MGEETKHKVSKCINSNCPCVTKDISNNSYCSLREAYFYIIDDCPLWDYDLVKGR